MFSPYEKKGAKPKVVFLVGGTLLGTWPGRGAPSECCCVLGWLRSSSQVFPRMVGTAGVPLSEPTRPGWGCAASPGTPGFRSSQEFLQVL